MNYRHLQHANLNPQQKTVLYIDGTNILRTLWHGAKSYGAHPMDYAVPHLYKLKTQIWADFNFMIFDGESSRELREAVYPEYKANRPEQSEEDKASWQDFLTHIQPAVKAMGITCYTSENGIEADDVIGILSVRSLDKGFNVLVASRDKDYAQLCAYSPYINIISSKTDFENNQQFDCLHESNFHDKFSILPEQFVDFLSLQGDKADNIMGIPKVGEKTAIKLITEYGGIDGIKKSLVQDGLLTLEEYHAFESLYRTSPIDEVQPVGSLKDGTLKQSLLEACKNGTLDLNRYLVSFQVHLSNRVNLSKEHIVPNKINTEELREACSMFDGLKSFCDYYCPQPTKPPQYQNQLMKPR